MEIGISSKIADRDEYFKQKAIEYQSHVVNFRTPATKTSEALVWTYRTTNCDVISVMTTSVLMRDGKMKDINIQPLEVKRLKPPTVKMTNKDLLGSSPYDVGLSVDIVKKTKKINQMLHDEKKEFMTKLNITRFVRSKLENDAATKIQSIYRGYYTRKNLVEIKYYLEVGSTIRSNIRSYLDSSDYMTVNLAQYSKERKSLRNHSATLIQCLFRKFLSRKCLRRRKYDLQLRRRNQAAVVMQARGRGISARARVKAMIEKRRIILYRLSVIKIQAALRGMFGRRRVYRRRFLLQFLAARMIQSWYRAKYSRRMTNHIKSVLQFRKSNKGATLMQGAVRRFLSVRRVNRIRLRKFHILITGWVTRIQTLIRKFLARVRVKKMKKDLNEKRLDEQILKDQTLKTELITKAEEERRSLLESADIFVQAEKGNTVAVEDIFKGLMGGTHTIQDVDAQGDNVFTISAKQGNTDLLRKCILWGFDINHRNLDGHSAIMIAAKNNQLSAFQYLLSFLKATDTISESSQSLILNDEDVGFLLVAATANCAIADLTMLQALLAQEIDVNSVSSIGMTAIHAACEIGHIEAFKLLLKNKSKLEGMDENGQTPLHKACSSSLQLVQWILGLDPEFSTFMSDSTRYSAVTALDADGKDCRLHAALAGQTEILELLDSIVQQSTISLPTNISSKKRSTKGGAEEGNDEISWSAHDITKAISLVTTGNVFCLHRVLDAGFDVDWQDVDTGLSMSLAACQRGDTDTIGELMEKSANFSLVDHQGRNCMHYAALSQDQSSALAVFLLSHPAASTCKISKSLFLSKDQAEDTPFHIAAREGAELNIDLLASEIFPAILNMHNKDGMTPLLLACSYYREKLINAYLKLGADAMITDNNEHGTLWHIFHPHANVLSTRRPMCSEFISIIVQGSTASTTRKEKDDEAAKLANEIPLVVALMKAGCTLYTDYGRSAEDVLALPYKPFVAPTAPHDPDIEPGDVLLQELSMGLIKAIVPSVINPLDAWRLFISSMRFDEGNMKMMQHLLRMGILDVIASESEPNEDLAIAAMAQAFSKPPEASTPSSKRVLRQSIVPMLGSRAMSTSSLDTYQLTRLNDVFFLDLNAVAWIISLKNTKALQHFIKKGYDVTLPVDTLGNTCLHYIAAHGIAEMVDVILAEKKVRFEALNPHGQTAGMIAAKVGNFKVAKRLFEMKISARQSLEGKYSAWVLAFARRYEKKEKNLQTRRYGDDDETYFSVDPDPFYSTWYSS